MKATKKPTQHGLRAEKALQMAVAGVVEEHRRLGLPIAVMKDGKAVFVNVSDGDNVHSVHEPQKRYKTR